MKTARYSHQLTTLVFSLSLLFIVLTNSFLSLLAFSPTSIILQIILAAFITSFFRAILKIIIR